MTLLTSKTLNNIVKIFSAIVIIAMAVISVTVFHADTVQLFIFLAYLAVYIQIPGLLILDNLRIRLDHLSSQIAVGFFTGWAWIILLYFVSDFIHTDILLYAAGPILSLTYFIIAIRNQSSSIRTFRFDISSLSTAFCIFVVLVFIYSMLRTQYIYLDPDFREEIYMNCDKAYHIGLINSLSHDYPLQSIWVQGRTIHYHIFSEILYAIPVRLFRLEADFIMLSCCPYMTTYVFAISVYAFFKEMCSKKDRAGIYSLLVVLSSPFLVRSATSSLALKFALVNENTVGYGIGGAMIFIIVLNRFLNNENNLGSGKDCVIRTLLLTVLLMLETGIKGPMGIVLLAGMWGTFLLGLILKKVPVKIILPLVVMTAGFAIIYMTILGMKGQSNGGGNSIFAAATISNICFWKPAVVEFTKKIGLPLIIRLGIVLVVFMIFMLTAYFLPFCIGYIRELVLVISGKKDFNFTKVTVYAATLVGLIAMFLLNYSGHSQVYFGFISVFFAPLISYWLFEDLEKTKLRSGSSKLINVLLVVFIVSIIYTSVSLVLSDIKAYKDVPLAADPDTQYDTYLSISNDEYDAMKWLEENTPEDSILATDRYYSVPLENYSYQNRWDNRFFLYADFSNRFCYIAGSGYNFGAREWTTRKKMLDTNAKLYDPNNVSRGDLARELGIDYVVVSRRFNNVSDLTNMDYAKCYTNDDIDIYQVK